MANEPIGGARELAQRLGERAKEDPERFARLALQFGPDIPVVAMSQVIHNVAGAIDLELLTELCQHASYVYDQLVGRDICLATEATGAVSAPMVALLQKYSEASDPDHETARTPAGDEAYFYGGDLFTAGLNSTRGGAARAIALILFAGDEHLNQLLPSVERLAADPIIAVRTHAAEAVIAILQYETELALDLAASLFDCSVDVFDAPSTERLLTHAVLRDPDRFGGHLMRALDGPPQCAKRAGHTWATAQHYGAIREPVPQVVSSLPPAARAGAAEVFAANVADSADSLTILFDDMDADVREAAARGMRHISQAPLPTAGGLVEAFVESPAFAEHMDDLVHGLEEVGSELPGATVDACSRVIDLAGNDLGDIRTSGIMLSRGLISVLLRVYRQSDVELRAKCLDAIDRLVELNAYGIAESLKTER